MRTHCPLLTMSSAVTIAVFLRLSILWDDLLQPFCVLFLISVTVSLHTAVFTVCSRLWAPHHMHTYVLERCATKMVRSKFLKFYSSFFLQALFTPFVVFQLLLLRPIKTESESVPESAVIGELGFSAQGQNSPSPATFGSTLGSLSQRNPFQLSNINHQQSFLSPQIRFPLALDNKKFGNAIFSQPIFPSKTNTNENLIRPAFQSIPNPRGQHSREELLR